MNCKKSLMGLAGLLIVVFHFWMPLTSTSLEMNIYKSTYLGVDIFFFVSAYSLSSRKMESYLKFLGNRVVNVYVPFVFLTIICAIYKKWSLAKIVSVIIGLEFLERGGGAFLWYIIAIMIMYIVAPLILKLKAKYGWKAGVFVVLGWAICVLILQYVFSYTSIFILLNRIPIFIIGLYYKQLRDYVLKHNLFVIGLGVIAGGFVVYNFCGNVRIVKPIVDIYYVFAIPFVVSVIVLWDFISTKISMRNLPLIFIGGITLELYGIQMIWGYDIEKYIYRLIKSDMISLTMVKVITFLLTTCCLIIISWVFAFIRRKINIMIFRRIQR